MTRQNLVRNKKIHKKGAAFSPQGSKVFIYDKNKLNLFVRMFRYISDKSGGIEKAIKDIHLGQGVYTDMINLRRLSTDIGYRILNKYKQVKEINKNQEG